MSAGVGPEANGASADEDHIRLTVPARPEYVRLARLTASSLAARLGFTYDEIEDLRLAVDELCFLLVGPGQGRDGIVSLTFSTPHDHDLVGGPALVIVGEGPVGPQRPHPDSHPQELGELRELILTALADEYTVSRTSDTVQFRMVTRRRSRT